MILQECDAIEWMEVMVVVINAMKEKNCPDREIEKENKEYYKRSSSWDKPGKAWPRVDIRRRSSYGVSWQMMRSVLIRRYRVVIR